MVPECRCGGCSIALLLSSACITLTSISATGNINKYGTLPASTRGSERSLPTATLRDERDHSGYFSDRNDSYGSRRDLYDRGYTSDHERRCVN